MKPTKQKPVTPAAAPAPETQAAEADIIDWSQYVPTGTTGFENVSAEDLGIPLLTIIQPKSPEVDVTHEDYATKQIKGAKPGDIINSLTRKVLASFGERPVAVIPCGYERTYVEWKPRAAGGGLVKVHRDSAILNEVTGKDEKGQDVLRSGNTLNTTMSFYLQVIDSDTLTPSPALVNMTSTQLKHGRAWLNIMTNIKLGPARITPPMYSHSYFLTSVIEKNEKGSWFGWKIEIGPMVTSRTLITTSQKICERVALASRPAPKQLASPLPDAGDDVPM